MSIYGSKTGLSSALDTVLSQTVLHGQLVWIELAEEKNRIFRQLAVMLLGFILLFCSLLSLSALAMIFSWDTPWRIPTIVMLTGLYMIGALVSLQQFRRIEALGEHAFTDTRRELNADIALMRSRGDV
ncbi:MAG: phage holin family protein [Pseudohongiella sp.]|jgi:uncharacterized membrane protein YqjE|nr:phage holin family protein [Pseudohongiella sp.]